MYILYSIHNSIETKVGKKSAKYQYLPRRTVAHGRRCEAGVVRWAGDQVQLRSGCRFLSVWRAQLHDPAPASLTRRLTAGVHTVLGWSKAAAFRPRSTRNHAAGARHRSNYCAYGTLFKIIADYGRNIHTVTVKVYVWTLWHTLYSICKWRRYFLGYNMYCFMFDFQYFHSPSYTT